MNQEAFDMACKIIIDSCERENGIGTLGEKTVHAVLKQYLCPDRSCQEQKVSGFVADIRLSDQIIEIQTRGFDKLRRKLTAFLPLCPVTIVYPVPHIKYLRWVDPVTGRISAPRKSPRHGTVYQIIPELYKIKPFLTDPNLRFKIVLIDMEEYRMLDGWSRDKKKGSTKCDRIPSRLYDEIDIDFKESWLSLLPDGLPDPFTSADYKKAARVSQGCAGTALHILHYAGCLTRTGKRGNSYLYQKN